MEGLLVACIGESRLCFDLHHYDHDADDTFLSLTMNDNQGNEIFQANVPEHLALGRKLSNLHESARRQALDVEQKISAVKNILKRI